MDQTILLLTIVVILQSTVIISFLLALIFFLLTLRKTVLRAQQVINNVEDTALRSLSPLLSFRALFSDTQGFVSAIQTLVKSLRGKKK